MWICLLLQHWQRSQPQPCHDLQQWDKLRRALSTWSFHREHEAANSLLVKVLGFQVTSLEAKIQASFNLYRLCTTGPQMCCVCAFIPLPAHPTTCVSLSCGLGQGCTQIPWCQATQQCVRAALPPRRSSKPAVLLLLQTHGCNV